MGLLISDCSSRFALLRHQLLASVARRGAARASVCGHGNSVRLTSVEGSFPDLVLKASVECRDVLIEISIELR